MWGQKGTFFSWVLLHNLFDRNNSLFGTLFEDWPGSKRKYLKNDRNEDHHALHYASAAELFMSVQLLLDQGADIEIQKTHAGTALQIACYFRHERVVQLLIDNGADVNAHDGWHENSLHIAINHDHETFVRLLLDNGADVEAQSGF